MCNLLWLCVCFLTLLPLALSAAGAKVNVTETDQTSLVNQNQNSSSLLPKAEQLIRYRRQPPYGAKRNKQRRRVKGSSVPKIKYGPPSYPPGPPGPPLNFYKPSSASSYPSHLEEPNFSIEDFQHLKFDGTDFHIPASSYEAQSMDLNLYSHEQEDNDLYGAHKFPSLEYSFAGDESPSLDEHTPHQKYGVPPLQQSHSNSHSYNSAPSYSSGSGSSYSSGPSHSNSHSYSAGPSHSYSSGSSSSHSHSSSYHPSHSSSQYPSHSHNSDAAPSLSYEANSYESPDTYVPQQYGPPSSAPAAPPSTRYGVPSYSQPGPPPAPDSYSIYEQKIPNTGYQQNFAEPPRSSPNYEIAYSPPAYEISTSYQQPKQPSHQPPPSSHDGHFAEPPPPPAASPQYTPHQQPVQHPAQPANVELPTSYTNVELHPNAQHYPIENYAPPAEELPLNTHHKFPSFDFPKSSYEVPIYDPIPFEASNKEEQESYPPIVQDPSNDLPPSDTHAAGTTQKSRKRKRRPSSAVIPKKHTLDVPELQEAYDADSHVHVRGTDLDTAAYGSRHVEQRHRYPSTTTTTTPAPWSPMRVRTTSSGAFIPTIITSSSSGITPTSPTQSSSRSRSRGTSRYHSTESPSTAVTIQKSRSQSYYDGTIAPPTYRQSTYGRGTRPTRPVQGRGVGATLALQPNTERSPSQKRTTKGVFDTTLFKSPQSDREMERKLSALRQNLPKNHKLY